MIDLVRGVNTFTAHRALSLAAERGVQAAAKAWDALPEPDAAGEAPV